MGKKSRDKGYRGENEAVNIAKSAGCDARRNFMSGMFDPDGTDLLINGQKVSVKRRANGMEWAYKELAFNDYVLFRADNKEWLKIKLWKP